MTKEFIISKIFQTLEVLPQEKAIEIFEFTEYQLSKYQAQKANEYSTESVRPPDEPGMNPLLDNNKASILVENIKKVILNMICNAEALYKIKNSDYISKKLHHNYAYLAKVFSKMTGVTIENYIIIQKIERVKELLLNDELNITQISYTLNYSSVAHLSNQFKKITGIKPTYYKATKAHNLLQLKDTG